MKALNTQQATELQKNLFFAGTIYDSFEALEEALGKLKLERPLFLLYLAKKAYAEEVFAAVGEKMPVWEDEAIMIPPSQIELNSCRYHRCNLQ